MTELSKQVQQLWATVETARSGQPSATLGRFDVSNDNYHICIYLEIGSFT